MATISTKLIRDGNSVAIRLPKTVLIMSGLRDDVQMEVKHGQITLRSAATPRAEWKERIAQIIAANPTVNLLDDELNDWEMTSGDGLDKH